MIRFIIVVLCLPRSSWSVEVKFPPWFKFGASTAAYQIEGGWNASDKSESIWDRFTHADPTVIADLSNGDVACDSYRLWRRDVEMAAELGLHFYRISLSWTRLLPSGYSNKISADGAKYYSDLIDALLEKGIEPVVTIYHFDLPQNLQELDTSKWLSNDGAKFCSYLNDALLENGIITIYHFDLPQNLRELGGWTNPLISDWFASYARTVFTLYSDRVKTWITINEPSILCDLSYSTGLMAPGLIDTQHGVFLCSKHVLVAHAKAWRLYDEQFKPLYHGKVSLSDNIVWYSPYSSKEYSLSKLALDFTVGRFTHPIYSKTGGWPPTTVKLMKEVSAKEGYEFSRLPAFTKEEVELVKGTYDYFALNYYTCRLVRRARPGERVDAFFMVGIPELRAVMEPEPGMPRAKSEFVVLCPKGLRALMSWLKDQYGDLQILITESGYSTGGMELKDEDRIEFIRDHLEQVLLSIKQDGVNITGYSYWSMMDNFEWAEGYGTKFGLYQVDFSSSQRERTPRASAAFYSQVIRSRAMRVTSANSKYFYNNN